MTKKERFERMIAYFQEAMPEAKTELDYENPYQLLVAVMLSAQCTDKRVNMVTPSLFEAYPDAHSLAKASVEDVFGYVRSVSYPNSKSEHLVGMALRLVSDFGGEVPQTIDELQTLPGVGRKTANVVVSVAFGIPAMPVDTHVFRVANRMGLTHNSKTPLETEKTLVKYIPEGLLGLAHHWLILHGRYVCMARTPKCPECGLRDICVHFKSTNKTSQR